MKITLRIYIYTQGAGQSTASTRLLPSRSQLYCAEYLVVLREWFGLYCGCDKNSSRHVVAMACKITQLEARQLDIKQRDPA